MATPWLFHYLQRVQQLVGFDETQAIFNISDLQSFVNEARDEVAAQGQCVRLLPKTSGGVMALQVTTPGVGYTNPALTISAPDAPSGDLPTPLGAQATGTVQQIGGQLSDASLTYGGDGYFQPNVTVSDPTGAGAVVQATVTPLNQVLYGQETYYFKDVDLSPYPGIRAILSVRSVSPVWAQWQWSASRVSFSKYQAMIRQYVASFYAPPVWCCQFGQGTSGSIKLYPIPDQSYQSQWDALCLPSPLEDDTSFEAIPEPWTKAVPYYAAFLALLSRSAEIPALMPLAFKYFNSQDGGLFGTAMRRARAFAEPGQVSSYYGRT